MKIVLTLQGNVSGLREWDEFAAARATQVMLYLRLGQLQMAEQVLDQLLPIPVRTVGFYAPLPTICALALLAAEQGDSGQAVELYTVASNSPLGSNSRWIQDVVGTQIDALIATMDPDSYQAARARGQTRDLYGTLTALL